MNKYCRKCGAKLFDSSKFCPNCGTAVENIQDTTIQTNMSDKERKIVMATIIIAILLIVGIIGGIFWYKKTQSQPPITQVPIPTQSDNAETTSVSLPTPEENILDKTQKIIAGSLNQGEKVVASTLGHNENGFLALINDGRGYYNFIIYDKKNDRIARVYFSMKTYNFYTKKSGNLFQPLIYLLEINNDTHDNDAQLGVWNGSKHTFPIYALFEMDQFGNVIPGMLYSGGGLNPSHYHEVLKEQKNVDMANILLTEMKPLHKYVDTNGVSIPVSR